MSVFSNPSWKTLQSFFNVHKWRIPNARLRKMQKSPWRKRPVSFSGISSNGEQFISNCVSFVAKYKAVDLVWLETLPIWSSILFITLHIKLEFVFRKWVLSCFDDNRMNLAVLDTFFALIWLHKKSRHNYESLQKFFVTSINLFCWERGVLSLTD